ncbi:MAG: valine--tRNA ligase [Peptococcaceae bacterium]|nr:valine--tRNA ligase [Peptococcaceae bacterium]
MPPSYNPKDVEDRLYREWEEKKYFHAEVQPDKTPFSIVMPPPNVTGELHMGHALDNTLQDVLIRWRRMQGYNTLWLPGTDHAGIATQAKVEAQLAKEGTSRYDLGRKKFLERVWDWKQRYGDRITNQLRRLGASCDWDRERFTMDEGCSEAVREVFLQLYEEGLIYRDYYIVNWCPKCNTTISDIEVEHVELPAHLYYIKYPTEDGRDFITVATTRPETMLGDTAVAVHPGDDRYQHLIGTTVILPLMNRPIPIIADDYVSPEFGTGAVKITPAHDPNDFEIGKRHKLPQIQVIDTDGHMTAEAGPYQGLDRWECRKKVLRDLEEQGLLAEVEDLTHAVGHCYRCNTVVEPMISQQWFVRMKPLAEPAIRVVKEGKIKFIPERFTKIYLNWLENIRDWCISRQLWWGHRIPVWYCKDCDEIITSKTDVTQCSRCGSRNVEQDPDVLDTWFSSALWPFSTMGWPEKTAELAHFYPTSVLVTGRDIIFFWVARMIFSGLKFMKEVPFREVFIHGLVLDALGRKMSKSLGNGVDPLEVIEQYGADSLRFMLVTGNTPGNDIRFQFEKVEGARNFANKLWNASRFVIMNLEGYQPGEPVKAELTLADRWILSRYQDTVVRVSENMEAYELGEAARVLYEFIWDEFCDWYIELSKPRLYRGTPEEKAAAQHVLVTVLEGTLKLLHPFMPFITEEIWHHLPQTGETVMLAPWPESKPELRDAGAEKQMNDIIEVIRTIRHLRSEMNVPPAKRAEAVLVAGNDRVYEIINTWQDYIADLARADVKVVKSLASKPQQAAHGMARGTEIYIPLAGLIDIDKELARLKKELQELEKELNRVNSKLRNEGFLKKAPAEIVAKEKNKQEELTQKRMALEARLRLLGTKE